MANQIFKCLQIRKSQEILNIETRKSSCVNATGIPTAAYQVLHLLSYPREGGIPHPWLVGEVPHPWLGGTPILT